MTYINRKFFKINYRNSFQKKPVTINVFYLTGPHKVKPNSHKRFTKEPVTPCRIILNHYNYIHTRFSEFLQQVN